MAEAGRTSSSSMIPLARGLLAQIWSSVLAGESRATIPIEIEPHVRWLGASSGMHGYCVLKAMANDCVSAYLGHHELATLVSVQRRQARFARER
ncbi:hypothetical protein F4780DRAFT_720293 [Xylariomycetidae sp. FL0641]|nr:hypothetical protein F4780DRAFT_720293 [Xylariomycetidae sp. FL0641]